ncbi:von willebrand factor a domain-containing protein 5a [Anaeramoeba flamelloides]|uniref:von willebrand factor a domain-containing protein 5a n=1 Tax=Anaeramoeba flamelloides TaxID=1746091 RepID=A0AAV7YW24_9EUKA|nr:von willebrand factor a domain-containing protein 5a [Anaeramoeba flamelloides]
MVGSGLINKRTNGQLPLTGVIIKALLLDFVGKVTAFHEFQNNSSNPIETIFVFPLNSRCIVNSFKVIKEKTQHKGKIGNKETNREIYEDQIAEGNTPIKLEQENNDLLIINVGNLQPKENCVIILSYIIELDIELNNTYRLHLPQSIYPKHVPIRSEQNYFDSDSSFLRFTKKVPYRIIYQMKFKMTCEIEKISSDTHHMKPKIQNKTASLEIIPNENNYKKDLILDIILKKKIKTGSIIGISKTFLKNELKKEIIRKKKKKKKEVEKENEKDKKNEKENEKEKKKEKEKEKEKKKGEEEEIKREKKEMEIEREEEKEIKRSEKKKLNSQITNQDLNNNFSHNKIRLLKNNQDNLKKAIKITKHCAMLTFCPEINEEFVSSEILFVLDLNKVFYSYQSKKIKELVYLCLHSIPHNCLFNIVSINAKISFLFNENSQKYKNQTLDQAKEFVKKIRPSSDFRELRSAFEQISQKKQFQNYPRQILVFTDRNEWNAKHIFSCVKIISTNTRFFTFGIGSCVSRNLIDGIARIGKGYSEMIVTDKNLKKKAITQLERSLQTEITDLYVKFHDMPKPEMVIPTKIPPIFNGTHLQLFAFLKENSPKGSVELGGYGSNGKVNWIIELDSTKKRTTEMVHALAAKRILTELEEGFSTIFSNNNSQKKNINIKNKIQEISKQFNVLCNSTSFLTINKINFKGNQGEMFTKRISILYQKKHELNIFPQKKKIKKKNKNKLPKRSRRKFSSSSPNTIKCPEKIKNADKRKSKTKPKSKIATKTTTTTTTTTNTSLQSKIKSKGDKNKKFTKRGKIRRKKASTKKNIGTRGITQKQINSTSSKKFNLMKPNNNTNNNNNNNNNNNTNNNNNEKNNDDNNNSQNTIISKNIIQIEIENREKNKIEDKPNKKKPKHHHNHHKDNNICTSNINKCSLKDSDYINDKLTKNDERKISTNKKNGIIKTDQPIILFNSAQEITTNNSQSKFDKHLTNSLQDSSNMHITNSIEMDDDDLNIDSSETKHEDRIIKDLLQENLPSNNSEKMDQDCTFQSLGNVYVHGDFSSSLTKNKNDKDQNESRIYNHYDSGSESESVSDESDAFDDSDIIDDSDEFYNDFGDDDDEKTNKEKKEKCVFKNIKKNLQSKKGKTPNELNFSIQEQNEKLQTYKKNISGLDKNFRNESIENHNWITSNLKSDFYNFQDIENFQQNMDSLEIKLLEDNKFTINGKNNKKTTQLNENQTYSPTVTYENKDLAIYKHKNKSEDQKKKSQIHKQEELIVVPKKIFLSKKKKGKEYNFSYFSFLNKLFSKKKVKKKAKKNKKKSYKPKESNTVNQKEDLPTNNFKEFEDQKERKIEKEKEKEKEKMIITEKEKEKEKEKGLEEKEEEKEEEEEEEKEEEKKMEEEKEEEIKERKKKDLKKKKKEKKKKKKKPKTTIDDIIQLQSAKGRFKYSEKLFSFIGLTHEFIQKSIPKAIKNFDIWSTILVIAFLRKNFKDYKVEWSLISRKSTLWIKQKIDFSDTKIDQLIQNALNII